MIFKVVSLVCFLALSTRAQHHEATSYLLSNLGGHGNVGHVQQTAGTYIHKYSAIPIVAKVPVATYKNYEEDKHYAPAHYEFKYAVEDKHTGDIKSQHEVREGDVVKGEYSLHDADGTVRTVKYTADKHSGFNAVVERTGHASHPQVVTVKSVHQVPLHHGIGSSHGLGYYH